MSEKPPSPEEEKNRILSFEEFTKQEKVPVPGTNIEMELPVYDNFFRFFTGYYDRFLDDKRFQYYNKVLIYKRFRNEHEELDQRFRRLVSEAMAGSETKKASEALKSVEKELYEAYKIMRSYGASDEDLFR